MQSWPAHETHTRGSEDDRELDPRRTQTVQRETGGPHQRVARRQHQSFPGIRSPQQAPLQLETSLEDPGADAGPDARPSGILPDDFTTGSTTYRLQRRVEILPGPGQQVVLRQEGAVGRRCVRGGDEIFEGGHAIWGD